MVRVASLLLAAFAIPAAACSADADEQPEAQAGGSGGQRSYDIQGFSKVALGAAGDVDVRVGPAFSVTATGSPASLDKIRVERDGDSLKLTRRSGVQWAPGDKVRFAVTMPRMSGADIGGSGTITVDRVEGDSFEGNIGGSGRLDLRQVRVDEAEFAIGGSGDIAAAGTVRELEVSIGGSGNVRVQRLRAETAELTIAGAGDIEANVARTADVTIVGSGDVTVTGGAKCDVTKMGSGRVSCG